MAYLFSTYYGDRTEPWWDAYRHDAEFKQILDEIRGRQIRMRNNLRANGL